MKMCQICGNVQELNVCNWCKKTINELYDSFDVEFKQQHMEEIDSARKILNDKEVY